MKIKEVRAIRTNRYCYAKITTDNGLHGIGESGAFGALDASAAQIENFGSYLVGKDPLEIEHLWQVMFRGSYFRGAAVMGAISAIDVALWDIAGKYYNVPIYQLLGGKCRDKIRVYGHVMAKTDEELVANCEKKRQQGYTAVGHLSPFLDEPESIPYGKTHVRNMEESIRRVHLMRQAVGDNIDLCIELHRRSLPAEAVVLIKEIEDVHPLFVEDPIPPGNNEAMAYVVSKSSIPIATGERLHTIFEFRDLLNRKATDYVRISLTTVGGITGARKIAAMAEAEMCPVVPHNPLSPVCTAAELQFCASIDNLLICEFPDPEGGLMRDRAHRKCELVTNYHMPVDGFVPLPEGPGLGIDLIDGVEEKFPAVQMPVRCRLNTDGSIRDQ